MSNLKSTKVARILSTVAIVLGAVFVVAGGTTWALVSSNLKAQDITVAEDASAFAGQLVDTPWEAWAQADIINHHALAATDGKTYSQLEKDDPVRPTAMNGALLRSALFTSIIGFGVSLLVVGIGVVVAALGVAVRALIPATATTPVTTGARQAATA